MPKNPCFHSFYVTNISIYQTKTRKTITPFYRRIKPPPHAQSRAGDMHRD